MECIPHMNDHGVFSSWWQALHLQQRMQGRCQTITFSVSSSLALHLQQRMQGRCQTITSSVSSSQALHLQQRMQGALSDNHVLRVVIAGLALTAENAGGAVRQSHPQGRHRRPCTYSRECGGRCQTITSSGSSSQALHLQQRMQGALSDNHVLRVVIAGLALTAENAGGAVRQSRPQGRHRRPCTYSRECGGRCQTITSSVSSSQALHLQQRMRGGALSDNHVLKVVIAGLALTAKNAGGAVRQSRPQGRHRRPCTYSRECRGRCQTITSSGSSSQALHLQQRMRGGGALSDNHVLRVVIAGLALTAENAGGGAVRQSHPQGRHRRPCTYSRECRGRCQTITSSGSSSQALHLQQRMRGGGALSDNHILRVVIAGLALTAENAGALSDNHVLSVVFTGLALTAENAGALSDNHVLRVVIAGLALTAENAGALSDNHVLRVVIAGLALTAENAGGAVRQSRPQGRHRRPCTYSRECRGRCQTITSSGSSSQALHLQQRMRGGGALSDNHILRVVIAGLALTAENAGALSDNHVLRVVIAGLALTAENAGGAVRQSHPQCRLHRPCTYSRECRGAVRQSRPQGRHRRPCTYSRECRGAVRQSRPQGRHRWPCTYSRECRGAVRQSHPQCRLHRPCTYSRECRGRCQTITSSGSSSQALHLQQRMQGALSDNHVLRVVIAGLALTAENAGGAVRQSHPQGRHRRPCTYSRECRGAVRQSRPQGRHRRPCTYSRECRGRCQTITSSGSSSQALHLQQRMQGALSDNHVLRVVIAGLALTAENAGGAVRQSRPQGRHRRPCTYSRECRGQQVEGTEKPPAALCQNTQIYQPPANMNCISRPE